MWLYPSQYPKAVLLTSLDYEKTDAETFASWGADLLKCISNNSNFESILTGKDDNCYSTKSKGYPYVDTTPPVSPSGRFAYMSQALADASRPILFAICEWGVDFPSAWAPNLGSSWKIANDIANDWSSIFRILN